MEWGPWSAASVLCTRVLGRCTGIVYAVVGSGSDLSLGRVEYSDTPEQISMMRPLRLKLRIVLTLVVALGPVAAAGR